MKKCLILMVFLCFLVSCAGTHPRYNENMKKNAFTWGVIGTGIGALVSGATGNSVGMGAAIGAVGGALLGAANTPRNDYRYVYAQDDYSYSNVTSDEYNSHQNGGQNFYQNSGQVPCQNGFQDPCAHGSLPYRRACYRTIQDLRRQEDIDWEYNEERKGENDAYDKFYGR